MSDLIDRQAALAVCLKYNGRGYVWSCIMGDIRKLPSAQPDVPDTNVGDTISRRAAIDVVKRLMGDSELSRTVQTGLNILPSAQPEKRTENTRKTHGVFLDVIDRQAAIDAVNRAVTQEVARWSLQELPSAQPEQHHDEWCTDCREYDKERHCCPRFNRVIRTVMADASRWIPCSDCERKCDKWENLKTSQG